MAIRGVNLKEQEQVIHPSDPGHPEHEDYIKADIEGRTPEAPTKYFIGNLTANDRVMFGDMTASPTMKDGAITMDLRNTKKAYEVVRRGLRNWENQQDSDGNVVPFKMGTGQDDTGDFVSKVDESCMVHLPHEIIMWLSGRIQEKNGMTVGLSKNPKKHRRCPTT